jgi:hypothetical protein
MKIEVSDDCADEIVVAVLKRSLRSARQFQGPHTKDLEYYRNLAAAITVVLAYYSTEEMEDAEHPTSADVHGILR